MLDSCKINKKPSSRRESATGFSLFRLLQIQRHPALQMLRQGLAVDPATQIIAEFLIKYLLQGGGEFLSS